MEIKLLTYIPNADFEDLVISALLSEDSGATKLEFRALTRIALLRYLELRAGEESRMLLVKDGLEPDRELDALAMKIPNLITISLDSTEMKEPSQIRSHVSRILRNLEAPIPHLNKPIAAQNLTIVTGTSGSPGVTTLTINLGHEISQQKSTIMVDAHPTRKDLSFLLGGKRIAERVQISNRLSIRNDFDETTDGIYLVDAGSAPDFSKAFTDRRLAARSYINLLESASRIIYLMAPENNHMFELESFLTMIESGRLRARPYFLLNQMGSSVREKSIQKRFLARVGTHFAQALPYDRESLARAKAAYSALKDVTPRSKLRRSISALVPSFIE